MRDLIVWIVMTFLVGPFEAQLERSLSLAGGAPALVQEVRACAREAAPALADRALAQPGWALGTALGVAIGRMQPEALLAETVPSCASAIASARTVLRRGQG